MKLLTEDNNNLLEINGLNVSIISNNYSKLLLKDIYLSIKRGSFTALVGKSGLGKSITIKSILGFLDNDSWQLEGNIEFFLNEKIYKDQEKTDSQLGIRKSILDKGKYNSKNVNNLIGNNLVTIFQGPDTHLNPSLKIGWQLGEMINPKKPLLENEEIEKRLLDVELQTGDKDKYPFQLAQGQKQRVLIGMVLGGSELVIADEPTSSLDKVTKSNIIKLLRKLREQSKIKTLLLITHDIDTIKELLLPSDPIYVMDYNPSGSVSIVSNCYLDDILKSKKDIHKILQPLDAINQINKVTEKVSKPILIIENLIQKYNQGFFKKEKEILKGINLEINQGEIVGIIGESGCGKTTLVKSILRLCNNTSGKILLKQSKSEEYIDLVENQPNGLLPDSREMKLVRKKLQVIFQNSSSTFNPRMMIHEILSETLNLLGIIEKDKIYDILVEKLLTFKLCKKKEEVLQILTKYPGELSGGEKQRLAILRAFLIEPEILIADEPLAEQDVITKREIIEMFQSINKNGCTIIIISHDLNLIKGMCNNIFLMKDGKLTTFNNYKN